MPLPGTELILPDGEYKNFLEIKSIFMWSYTQNILDLAVG